MQGYNFTEHVRVVLMRSREAAAGLGHQYVAPEHLLLALSRSTEGVAVAVLSQLGIESANVEREVIERLPQSKAVATGPDLPWTSSAKKILELAMAAARDLNHSYIGTEHILLALINEGTSIAAQALATLGVTAEGARRQTLLLLNQDPDRQASAAEHRHFLGDIGPTTHRLARLLHSVAEATTPAAFFARLVQIDGGAHHLLTLLSVDVAALEWEIAQREWIGGSIIDLLSAANAEKRSLRDPAIGTQHVLLAYLALSPAHGYRALSERGVTHASVRALAEKIFG